MIIFASPPQRLYVLHCRRMDWSSKLQARLSQVVILITLHELELPSLGTGMRLGTGISGVNIVYNYVMITTPLRPSFTFPHAFSRLRIYISYNKLDCTGCGVHGFVLLQTRLIVPDPQTTNLGISLPKKSP